MKATLMPRAPSLSLHTFDINTEPKLTWDILPPTGYTIMGKTADLTIVQKTITDTLYKEAGFGTCPHCQKH
ncbi:hypothetical protein QQF64_029811 [Cirrhinus molitorella]|uniref:Uncharacterized protein n=1 Tax=Cirrhinus molitorella TaxID=172907 RepID=A0ABR3N1I9_9TELE